MESDGSSVRLIEALKKGNERLKVIHHLFKAYCETKGQIKSI